jgi:hypothetical protein
MRFLKHLFIIAIVIVIISFFVGINLETIETNDNYMYILASPVIFIKRIIRFIFS